MLQGVIDVIQCFLTQEAYDHLLYNIHALKEKQRIFLVCKCFHLKRNQHLLTLGKTLFGSVTAMICWQVYFYMYPLGKKVNKYTCGTAVNNCHPAYVSNVPWHKDRGSHC